MLCQKSYINNLISQGPRFNHKFSQFFSYHVAIPSSFPIFGEVLVENLKNHALSFAFVFLGGGDGRVQLEWKLDL